MNNVAVYTCVVTDFEHQGAHVFEDDVDYLYFTDGASQPMGDKWQIHKLPDLAHLHPRRAAKLPKVYPHFFDILTKYEYTIWIDGDMQIIHPRFTKEALSYLKNGMVLTPHFDNRDCAYGEAMIRPFKYAHEPMDQQIDFYMREGFPHNMGLYEGGVIIRNMQDPRVKELGMMWYIHNMVFSYQDQVSLPYCLWKMDYKPDVLPKSFREFDWLWVNAHKRED